MNETFLSRVVLLPTIHTGEVKDRDCLWSNSNIEASNTPVPLRVFRKVITEIFHYSFIGNQSIFYSTKKFTKVF